MKLQNSKKIKLPAIIVADDYHDFPAYIDLLKTLGVKVKFSEIGNGGDRAGGAYYAVIYTYSKPHKKILKKLLIDYGFTAHEADSFLRHGHLDCFEDEYPNEV